MLRRRGGGRGSVRVTALTLMNSWISKWTRNRKWKPKVVIWLSSISVLVRPWNFQPGDMPPPNIPAKQQLVQALTLWLFTSAVLLYQCSYWLAALFCLFLYSVFAVYSAAGVRKNSLPSCLLHSSAVLFSARLLNEMAWNEYNTYIMWLSMRGSVAVFF